MKMIILAILFLLHCSSGPHFGGIQYPGKGVYTGDIENGLPNGKGTFQSMDGSRYIGSYVNGSREGYGELDTPEGDRYSGEWFDDKMHGKGTLRMHGGVTYVSVWGNSQNRNSNVSSGRNGK